MGVRTFCSSCRSVTRVSRLAEATELVMTMENPQNIVFAPAAGDQSDQISVTLKVGFETSGTLRWKMCLEMYVKYIRIRGRMQSSLVHLKCMC